MGNIVSATVGISGLQAGEDVNLLSLPAFPFNTEIDDNGVAQFDSAAPATEYYHAGFGHYFVTGNADEAAAIDSGAIKGWTRTGQTYSVYSQSAAGLSPVCRFFTTSFAPKSSHFYTPSVAECAGVKTNPNWQFEGNAFYVNEASGGICPSGTVPLYRIYNDGHSGAPNHRYTTCTTIRDAMVSHGWVSEGVAMCVPAGSRDCATDNSGGGVNYNLPSLNGVCGSANGGAVSIKPTANLCAAGASSAVGGSGPWTWTCSGSNGGSNVSCSASYAPAAANGVCGSANGATLSSKPTVNLCAAGTASTVGGTGPWSWTCAGSNGGGNVSCSAALATAPSGGSETWSFQEIGSPGNIATATLSKSGSGAVAVTIVLSYFDSDYGVTVSGTVAGSANVNASSMQIGASGTLYGSNGTSGQCTAVFSGAIQNATASGTGSVSCPSASYYTSGSWSGTRTRGSGVTSGSNPGGSVSNDVCGSSSGITTSSAPSANLCVAGTAVR